MSKYGTYQVGRMVFGSTEIAKGLLGTTLVFQKGQQPAPQPQQYTITKYPSSIDADNTHVYSWVSRYPASNGYTDATSSTEARANMVRGSRAETFIYWKFDLDEIPDNATIESITLSVKARRSAGTIVTAAYLVVCNGTTQVGNTSTISGSTATTFTLDVGTGWTGASIKNISILQYCKRSTINVNSTYFMGFYGATLTITYTA